jgi:transposase
MFRLIHVPKSYILKLSDIQKKELNKFMKSTRDKEEYRRASAVKQKMEGIPYRTIAKNLGVNYRNVYDWINNYRKYDGIDGIRNKRMNAGRKPVISTDKNKEMVKDIVLNKSPQTFGYLKNTWSIRLLATYLSSLLEMNVSPMQTWRIIHDMGIVYKQPKLELEKGNDYEEKKKVIDRYKKVSSALFKKDSTGI